ncbi:MAG: hypothetical protein JWL76_1394 [Thermoleophilia bacterium]|nr:hypothetical protein [Thermoleophilia bacterium]
MWRLPDGALDATYDGPTGTGNGVVDVASPAVALYMGGAVRQPDGKVISVSIDRTVAKKKVLVTRVDANGVPDPGFGTANGQVTIDIGAGDAEPASVQLRGDGRIFIAANVNQFTPANSGGFWDIGFIQLNSDGTLDPTFDGPSNGNGWWVHDCGAGGGNDWPSNAIMLPNNETLVGISCGQDSSGMIKLRADGAIDATWDGDSGTANGVLLYDQVAGYEYSRQLIDMNDGTILGVTLSNTGGFVGALRIASTTGVRDVTFDGASGTGNGLVSLPGVPAGWFGSAGFARRANNGDILVFGSGAAAVVARFNAAGVLDPTWDGPSGTGNGFSQYTPGVSSALVTDDGRIYMAARSGTTGHVTLTALLRDGAVDQTFTRGAGTTGTGTVDITAYSGWVPQLLAELDGRIVIASTNNGNSGIRFGRISSGTVSQFGAPDTWGSFPTGFFAACQSATTSSTPAAGWALGTCTAGGTGWSAVPTSATDIATTTTGIATATSTLRFGAGFGAAAAPGTWVAPLTFSVVAP